MHWNPNDSVRVLWNFRILAYAHCLVLFSLFTCYVFFIFLVNGDIYSVILYIGNAYLVLIFYFWNLKSRDCLETKKELDFGNLKTMVNFRDELNV